MTSAFESALSAHADRIKTLETLREQDRDRLDRKMDKLLYWIMGTLGAAVLSLLGTVVTLLKH